MPESNLEPKELIEAINRFTTVIEKQAAQQRDWKLALRNGLLAGLGGVIGATVVVSILVWIIQPFRRLDAIGPMIDHLDTALRQTNKR
jgi:hypothetical protein